MEKLTKEELRDHIIELIAKLDKAEQDFMDEHNTCGFAEIAVITQTAYVEGLTDFFATAFLARYHDDPKQDTVKLFIKTSENAVAWMLATLAPKLEKIIQQYNTPETTKHPNLRIVKDN